MRIRATAALTFAIALLSAGALSAQSCTEPGKARWTIKAGVTAAFKTGTAKSVPLSDLLALPEAAGITKNDRLYATKRIPTDIGTGLKEGDKVSTEGYFRLVATEDNDCEYHMQLSNAGTDTDVLIVEIARDDATSIMDPWLRTKAAAVRDFVRTKLVRGVEPSKTGNVMQHLVYVKVTGQLFYDDAHVGDQPRGKKGMKSPTLWEIHPVTAISFAPKP